MYNLGARLHCKLCFSACFANGTIAFENPNTILYTDVMAVQYEGVANAFNCDCTWSGNWVLITGCNTVCPTFGATLKYRNFKVSKGAKIRNRYNQVPHLTKDTNGKVTSAQ